MPSSQDDNNRFCMATENQGLEIINMGCRLNAYESEVIRQINTSICNNDGKRIIVNTCSVTKSAAAQSMRTVKKMRRLYPEAEIYVTGCASQLKPYLYDKIADRIIGNADKLLPTSYAHGANKIIASDMQQALASNNIMLDRFKNKARAFVEIQNGCNHSCTFCNIPTSRGKNRSIAPEQIIEQALLLRKSSYNEITLTGVDITDYGTDIGTSLTALIIAILQNVPDLERLRLSSIDVAEIDNDFIKIFATEKRLMPHLHLSIQSGDDLILKRMRRRHSRDQVYAFCDTIRTLRKDATFGADVIAGFPTETEEMFANTFNMLKELAFPLIHVFSFSANDGTPAARMPQLEHKIIKARAVTLRSLAKSNKERFLSSLIGSHQRLLLETPSRGKTAHYIDAELTRPMNQKNIGDMVDVVITGHADGISTAEPLNI